MSRKDDNPLHRIMNPGSIATVGAGNNPFKMGTLQALSIIKDGYRGKFLPVHPHDKTVLGHRAYRSVADLPEVPDLALFIVPTAQLIPLLADFGKIGTRYAVICTAGFREVGAEGDKLEKELKETAEKYGIRFLGPNCIGLINSNLPLNITVMTFDLKPGLLGMASQSGTYITQTLAYLKRRGIRFSKAISVGNEANIDIVDALEYLGEDEDTKAIALYIEGIRDGDRFLEVARQITPRKPVVAQYVGGTEAGARAGSSHTGAMAGPDYLYEGIFKQAGIIRVHSVEELYAHGWALATQPLLKGRRVGVLTNSGGPGTAIANTCNMGGLEVPRFSEELQKQIRPLLESHAQCTNPVDMTFNMDTMALGQKIPELIIKSNEVDGIIIHGVMGNGFLREIYPHLKELMGAESLEDFIELMKITDKDVEEVVNYPKKKTVPFLISSFLDRFDDFNRGYRDQDVPVYDGPEKTAWAMLSLMKYMEIRNRKERKPPRIPVRSDEAAAIIGAALDNGQKALDEYQSKHVLAAYGVPVAPERLVFTEEEAVEAARRLGFPVVLKGCSAEIMHKTEAGLIHLRLRNEDEVRRSFTAIREAAGDVAVLVSGMVAGEREFVIGMTRFRGFAPIIMFGLGGIFTEALQDNSFRVAPLSIAEAKEMIDDIRGRKILGAFRKMPAVNISELCAILQTVGFIGMLHPEIKEIDINPVIISGSDPVAVDALMIIG
ncbi:MAG: acetate--CoA ligase family protein [Dethiobacteria bacterium]